MLWHNESWFCMLLQLIHDAYLLMVGLQTPAQAPTPTLQ
jgi:hypothetical protein